MVRKQGIDRAQFLRRAGALGLVAATGSLLGASGSAATVEASAPGTGEGTGEGTAAGRAKRGLAYRGVCYDTGTNFGLGSAPLSREVWNRPLMRGEIRAISERLHCGSVSVFGTDLERLADTSTEAAERGLHVWLQPRLVDHPQEEILDHLAQTARHAERLKRQHAAINLNVGCEYVLFAPGIVPGATWQERIENLSRDDSIDFVAVMRRLNVFLGQAAAAARSHFTGRITYAAASFEQVDWRPFDFVGLDYYSFHPSRAGYIRELRGYRRWNKPIVISEFGCCTFEGAQENPGDGWTIIDYTKEPPELTGNPVRSEQTQADYLLALLDVFESEGLYSASVYSFISPDVPHSRDPRHDYDMASYAVVKVIRDHFEDPASPYRWKPKLAFHALARRYGAAKRRLPCAAPAG
jgi:hypothetical protein